MGRHTTGRAGPEKTMGFSALQCGGAGLFTAQKSMRYHKEPLFEKNMALIGGETGHRYIRQA